MIKYRLGCRNGHEFEAWFQNSAAFETLQSKGEVQCAACGTEAVDRLPMSPGLMTTRGEKDRPSRLMKVPDREQRKIVAELDKLRAKLLKSSEYVGARFAEEARKIHYGESEERVIHGEANLDETRALVEEGISFGVIPALPKDNH